MDAWILPQKPALVLAPMEGVTDAPMRALMTELPGFTHTVTEFLRVSNTVLPKRTIRRHMTELSNGSRTKTGIPVTLQLLGGDPERLALTAKAAVELGALGIDLNFGCPAPTVNRNDGGATLLKFPHRIEAIVRTIRDALPKEIPVSAKLRLGFDDPKAIYENAERAARGGAAWITIHGRTKTQGYTPPAYWGPIGEVRRNLDIPVVANGEIWTLDDLKRCRDETGCEHFMLGRGALANPYLPALAARELGILQEVHAPYPDSERWHALLTRFLEISAPLSDNPNYALRRVKQWLGYVHRRFGFEDFHRVKLYASETELRAALGTLSFPTPEFG